MDFKSITQRRLGARRGAKASGRFTCVERSDRAQRAPLRHRYASEMLIASSLSRAIKATEIADT